MAKEASFDIVSKTDLQEVANAIHQVQKELETRFDFKGSKSDISLHDEEIVVVSDDEYKLASVIDILQTKLIKRGVSLKSLDYGVIEPAAKGTVRQNIRIKQGLEQELAKKIIKVIKDSKLKVQATLQGDQVRVTGKSRDDLQLVIQSLKEQDFPVDLQFVNYR
ncbi:YajQ family cyclic di-GMP-binding protein [Sulfoacidibacillus thermotolerans]|uniref:Nucleotide-binding protein BM613_04750 n=1 Tax=Sulfoacidibacillus thermotolerans TaxID=1765684 RepID=A0A2U3DAC9_SULT2|nr:YajQ family cyclic di-GMP-binding protein [Sulfoacidibacillus thermotolerans]PWI58240.1 YajQ family cyclic di-GMP-binding protein [Sulfoacidibacillus thermotolerans]